MASCSQLIDVLKHLEPYSVHVTLLDTREWLTALARASHINKEVSRASNSKQGRHSKIVALVASEVQNSNQK